MDEGKIKTQNERRGEPGEAKASSRKSPMTSSVLGWTLEVLPSVRSTTAGLQAASRHRPVAFDSEGSPLGHGQSVINAGR